MICTKCFERFSGCESCHEAELASKDKYIEAQDVIISGQRKEIGTKDAEIARLRAALDVAFDFANAHSLPCLEDAMKIALEAT